MLEDIQPQEIDGDTPLFADGLGLDSIDALELAVAIGRRYKVQIKSDDERNREIFRSVRTLAAFIAEEKAAPGARPMTRDEIFDPRARAPDQDVRARRPRNHAEALLYQDLDLDSIDAIDMVVYLQDWTGREVPEEALRAVRTVDDVVSMVETHLAGGPRARAARLRATSVRGTTSGATAGAAAARPDTPFALGDEPRSWGDLLADAAAAGARAAGAAPARAR